VSFGLPGERLGVLEGVLEGVLDLPFVGVFEKLALTIAEVLALRDAFKLMLMLLLLPL